MFAHVCLLYRDLSLVGEIKQKGKVLKGGGGGGGDP